MFGRQAYLLFAVLLLVVLMAGCGGSGGGGILGPSPTVTSTSPANGATGVPINSIITATFSTAMNPSTITTETFTLMKDGTTPVAGEVTYAGTTASFAPLKPDGTPGGTLAPNTTYTATITTGVHDLDCSTLASNKVWTFKTGPTIAQYTLTVNAVPPTGGV